MKKLLWVGDAGCPSGFAVATHQILDTLRHQYEVTVLGINYRGDPHLYPYPIYVALVGGDWMGAYRLNWMCDVVKPDVIVIQQDGWNIPGYMKVLKSVKEHAEIPVVVSLAVDGKNFQGKWLDGVTEAIFWTQFGLDEARQGGYQGLARVIPLGVDLATYYPMDRFEARRKRQLIGLEQAFVVGSVNRNQPRKRWDLTVKYFAEWITKQKINDAYLFLHSAPTGDTGCNVIQLMQYYGVLDKLALMEPSTWYGVSDDDMRETYNCMDVYISTTQGEGMGLPAMEAMACGVPCILPDWAAFGEWADDAAWLVPCPTTAIGPPYVNVIGGVPDQVAFTTALNRYYVDPSARQTNRGCGLARVRESRFRWENVGLSFAEVIASAIDRKVGATV